MFEFYITNVCNLTCNGCNRFNNYAFTGFQRWKDYQEDYEKWGERIDLPRLSILGGEPTLNPTFMDWFRGLRKIWPDSHIEIVTNGTRLDKVKGLYDEVLKYKNKTAIDVNIHSKELLEYCQTSIYNFLEEPITEFNNGRFLKLAYNNFKGEGWPDSFDSVNDLPTWVIDEIRKEFNPETPFLLSPTRYIDKNGVRVKITYSAWFIKPGLFQEGSQFKLHNSDPKKAHDVCYSKRCHHFYKGRLHKCMITALLPEFDKQHTIDVNMSNSDRNLIHNANSIGPYSTEAETKEFYKFIESDTPIPQCKFCPEENIIQYTNSYFKNKSYD